MAAGLTLDSGALIAAEKGARPVWAMLKLAKNRRAPLTVPAVVLAQVWRANNPRIALLLQSCAVDALVEATAKRTGNLLGASRTTDVIDAAVVTGAVARGDAILTSDPHDIRRLLAALGSQAHVIRV